MKRYKYIGPAGSQGDRGPIGPEGGIGPIGNKGPDGAQGPTGPQGPIGSNAGITGPVGPIGAQGPQGDPGLTGLQGIPGVDGADGNKGPVGPAGADGTSANEMINIFGSFNTVNVLIKKQGAFDGTTLLTSQSALPQLSKITIYVDLEFIGGLATVTLAVKDAVGFNTNDYTIVNNLERTGLYGTTYRKRIKLNINRAVAGAWELHAIFSDVGSVNPSNFVYVKNITFNSRYLQ